MCNVTGITDTMRGSVAGSDCQPRVRGWGQITPYNGLYEEATPERDTFFRHWVYERVGISRVEA